LKKFLIIIGLLIVIAVAVLRFLGPGLGFGKGEGKGMGEDTRDSTAAVASAQPNVDTDTPPDEGSNTTEIVIVVKQGEYFIESRQITLDSIKDQIQANAEGKVSVVIEDDYGSAKAWDDIQKLMNELGIAYTEKNS